MLWGPTIPRLSLSMSRLLLGLRPSRQPFRQRCSLQDSFTIALASSKLRLRLANSAVLLIRQIHFCALVGSLSRIPFAFLVLCFLLGGVPYRDGYNYRYTAA